MTNTKRGIYACFITLIFIAFYVSSTFFYHTHQLDSGNVTHSHPFSSQEHSHSSNALQSINHLTTILFILCGASIIEKLFFFVQSKYNSYILRDIDYISLINIRLRAPPKYIFSY